MNRKDAVIIAKFPTYTRAAVEELARADGVSMAVIVPRSGRIGELVEQIKAAKEIALRAGGEPDASTFEQEIADGREDREARWRPRPRHN